MDRRAFMGILTTGLLGVPLAPAAQPARKVYRVGALGVGTPDLLRRPLREAGYMEGSNLAVEWRDAGGKPERFDDLAAELVRLKVDVIVAANPAATFAAKRATTSIP